MSEAKCRGSSPKYGLRMIVLLEVLDNSVMIMWAKNESANDRGYKQPIGRVSTGSVAVTGPGGRFKSAGHTHFCLLTFALCLLTSSCGRNL